MNIYLLHSILVHTVLIVIVLLIPLKTSKKSSPKRYYIDFISSKHQIVNYETSQGISQITTQKNKEEFPTKQQKSKPTEPHPKTNSIKTKQIDDPDYLYKNVSKIKPSMAEEESSFLGEITNQKYNLSSTQTLDSTPIKTDSDFPYPWYISKLRSTLWDSWQEEVITAKNLSVIVKFKIIKSGEIRGIEIEKTSGNKLFDFSALNSVMKIKKFQPLPPDFKDDYLTVYVEFKSTY